MSSFLKGNFTPKKTPQKRNEQKPDEMETRFEREALKHLGGSIAFVSKHKVIWDDDEGM